MVPNVRIFLVSSPLTTALMAGYAQRTQQTGDQDMLLIDALLLSESQVATIRQAASLHSFSGIYDFSLRSQEGVSRAPSSLKQLTRKLKTRPFFKQIYDFLYGFKLRAEDRKYWEHIQQKVPQLEPYTEPSAIHSQPSLHLNRILQKKYPQASLVYFEHGLGDYLDVRRDVSAPAAFCCLFAESYRSFWEARGGKEKFIQPVLGPDGLGGMKEQLLGAFPVTEQIAREIPSGRSLVLILPQPLEQQKIALDFWEHFLQLSVNQLEEPAKHLFLIKPHPLQGPESIATIEAFFEDRGLAFQWLDSPAVRSLNIELFYPLLEPQLKAVFSPFSSAVFYLPLLFPNPNILFGYSLEALRDFDQHTPQLYLDRWKMLEPYVSEVFGAGSVDISARS
jgi:hypothetical protein